MVVKCGHLQIDEKESKEKLVLEKDAANTMNAQKN